jgi:hypothetical protein
MTFDQIVEHLCVRGFVTRQKWEGGCAVVLGVDNLAWEVHKDNRKGRWSPTLAEIKADDWIALPYFWTDPQDDFKPFVEIPLLDDGSPRVVVVHDEEGRPTLIVKVAEGMPVDVLGADPGLKCEVIRRDGRSVRICAKRVADPPGKPRDEVWSSAEDEEDGGDPWDPKS